jgi:tetratricopeptide (TPR) repeat protein
MKTMLGAAVTAVLLASMAMGQAMGPAGGTSATAGSSPGGGGAGSYNRSPMQTSPNGSIANANQNMDQAKSGDYLTGNVDVQGNPLLWDPIAVTVYCEGKSVSQVWTDGKGRFRFQSTTLDSPTPTNTKDIKLTAMFVGCTVRAALAGYRSSGLVIANRNQMDNPDIGTVKLSIDEHANGTATSATSTTAPPNAIKEFEKARDEYLTGKLDKAQGDLKKAAQIYPQFAEAWYQLGKLQRKANDATGARESFSKALTADPKYLPPYEQLAELDALDGKWQDVENRTSEALKLDASGSAQIWYYDALAKFKLGKAKEAEESAKKALEMDPAHSVSNTEQLLAVMEAGRGDYSEALQHLKNALTYLPAGPNADLVKQQIAMLESQAPAK